MGSFCTQQNMFCTEKLDASATLQKARKIPDMNKYDEECYINKFLKITATAHMLNMRKHSN